MDYNLVATGLDGTLLDSSKKISEDTVKAVKNLTDTGVTFVIATGRPYICAEKYISQLGLQGPMITYDGARIVEAPTGRVLYECDMTRSDALKIWDMGQTNNVTICVWSDDKLYGNRLDERMQDYTKDYDFGAVKIDHVSEVFSQKVLKMLWLDEPDKIQDMLSRLNDKMFLDARYCTSEPTVLEFFRKEVSKANALWQIATKRKSCDGLYKTIAIGDGNNDIEMIRQAGMGVAMENASVIVKAVAKHITTSNDEEGVLKALRKFFPEVL